MKVATSYERPPGPGRANDWSAYDDDRYDPFDETPSAVGRGATEDEAIRDLMEAVDWDGPVTLVARDGVKIDPEVRTFESAPAP